MSANQHADRDDILRQLDITRFYKDHLKGFRLRSGNSEATVRCPFHDDKTPSMSVNVTTGLYFCHKCNEGGSPFDFIMKSKGVDFVEARRELVERYGLCGVVVPINSRPVEARMVANYGYRDEAGNLLFEVVRFDPKDFRQRRLDGNDGWIWNTEGVRRVPYNLPHLIATVKDGGDVYIVEGEKDVEAVLTWPGNDAQVFSATCNPGGAGKWRPEYNEHFRGAKVTIVADRDEPGRRHARQVYAQLKPVAASVRVAEAAVGKDLSDHLEAELGLERLVDVTADIERALAVVEPPPATEPARTFEPAIIDIADAIAGTLQPVPYRLEPYLAAPDNLLIGGEWGSGKSPLALALTFALALNVPFLGGVSPCGEPDVVGVLDDENGEHLVRQRLQLLARGLGADAAQAAQRIVYCGRSGWRDLGAPDRKDALARLVERHKITRIVLDSLVRFIGGRDENSSSDMSGWYEEVVLWLNTQLDVRVVAIHHWRKPSKDQNDPRHRFRGSSDIPAQFDQVWAYEMTTEPNTRNLLHVRSRWGDVAQPACVRREGCLRDGFTRLVAIGMKSDAETLIWAALTEARDRGELRDDIVQRLVRAGFTGDAANQACTRTLGRWKEIKRVVSRLEGRKARYWMTESAPAELRETLFSGAAQNRTTDRKPCV